MHINKFFVADGRKRDPFPRMEIRRRPPQTQSSNVSPPLCLSCLDFTFFPVTHKCSSCKACPCSSRDPTFPQRNNPKSRLIFPYVALLLLLFHGSPLFPRAERGAKGISRVTLCGDSPSPALLSFKL